MKRPPNYHAILIQYVGPTATKGSKTKLISFRFEKDSISEGYSSEHADSRDQGMDMLRALGYNIVGMAEAPNGIIAFTDTFLPLKEAAAKFRKQKKQMQPLA